MARVDTALIITFYQATNYGAFLQAFAMQTFLKQQGVDAKIYRWVTPPKLINKVVGSLYNLIKPRKELPQEATAYRAAVKAAVIQAQKEWLSMSDGKEKVDLTVLGSDEIWNVRNIGSSHEAFFFAPNKKSQRTISYAACAGKTSVKELRLFPYAIKGIKKIDVVSVRDDSTEEIVKKIGRRDYCRVLDPTFLIDFDEYLPDVTFDSPYLFVYSYGLREEEVIQIRNIAEEKNLKIVATGAYYEWADFNLAPSPFEWVSMIRNATIVVTTTFHGTVFAVLQKRNFAVFRQSPKVRSVLKELGLYERLISDERTLSIVLDNPIDYSKIQREIDKKVQASQCFIIDNLEV